MALSDADRLREEDPFTGEAVRGVPQHVIAHRSRFEFDLNRDSENAVYRTPEQSWGLEVWKSEALDDELVQSVARPPRRILSHAGQACSTASRRGTSDFW